MNISDIDKNFKVDKEIDKTGLKFYSVDEPPFRLYGVVREGDHYTRVPSEIAKGVSVNVASLALHTAGGRVRFVTDSKRIAVRVKMAYLSHHVHMPLTNEAGVDIYVDNKFAGIFIPPKDMPNMAYESLKSFDCKKERLITLNFPLYGALSEISVGIEEGATLKSAPDHKYEIPVVFYGSSITQGGCSSRPGMAHTSILSRRLDCNIINLGFSGNAKGEPSMAKYIAGLDMSVFVCGYDHNAPTPEHLLATHEPFYRIVREAHPELPIIFMTRPSEHDDANRLRRRDIIRTTYDKAVAEGDRNVYFIDTSTFFGYGGNEHTVDDCHPTDLGFMMIANGMETVLRETLEK